MNPSGIYTQKGQWTQDRGGRILAPVVAVGGRHGLLIPRRAWHARPREIDVLGVRMCIPGE